MLQNKWSVVPCTQPNATWTWKTTCILTDIYMSWAWVGLSYEIFYGSRCITVTGAATNDKNVDSYTHKYLQVTETIAKNPTGNIKLVLRSPGKQVDPCRYNLPTGTMLQLLCQQKLLKHLKREMLWSISLLRTIPMVTHWWWLKWFTQCMILSCSFNVSIWQ